MLRLILSKLFGTRVNRERSSWVWRFVRVTSEGEPAREHDDAQSIERRSTTITSAKRAIIALAEALARQAARDDDVREQSDGGGRSTVDVKS